MSIDQQLEYLRKGFAQVITEGELRARLEESHKTGRPLRVKAGFDPTAPDLHLGHTVLIRKMRHFQDLGHRAVFVIGDVTGLIGDPSGRNAARPPMTREQILKNAETYKEQVFTILDKDKTEVRLNSEWLLELGTLGMIQLSSHATVAQMLEREDFSSRYRQGKPIGLHEFLYPLTQAQDSVALRADIELGGTDQTFNLLLGRELQATHGQRRQIVATVPILEGLDGVQKMSKSLGNYIGVSEPAEVMYRKVMQISDSLMFRYYELLTDLSMAEILRLRHGVENGSMHPMEVKHDLAARIVADFHGQAGARSGRKTFRRVVQQKKVPETMAEFPMPAEMRGKRHIRIDKLLRAIGLARSGAEANRMLRANAVAVNGTKHRKMTYSVPSGVGELILKFGKKWARVRL
ncbi:MAG: tyrosine--tRNA ligase [Bryobacterales bacterium]|nr:tyrosine--tRNA ligase [Bryobacterales bacterium]